MRRLLEWIALYGFHVLVARPVLYWFVGVRYRRRAAVPEGPCLVVSNHNSHLDAAVLMTLFPLRRLRHVHPVAAADYFGQSAFRRGVLMMLMNGLPIRRRPGRGEDPLAPVVEELRRGESLIFFPEGSRGEAGVVARFRPGVGMLVRSVPGLQVVPVFLSGPERIWPRGKLPVPLSIDVHVGKPRSYSPDADAREIAEQVRSDVLALAPPAPPVPGERPAPPLRVALAGIDAGIRHRAWREIARRLGEHGRTLAVGEPMLEASDGELRETTGPLPTAPWGRTGLGLLTRLVRTGEPFRGADFVSLVDRVRTSEVLERGRDMRFVVEASSALVTLPAWSAATADGDDPADRAGVAALIGYLLGPKRVPWRFWPLFWRRAPEVWLFNVLDLGRPPVPALLVRLRADPAQAMLRLRSVGTPLERRLDEPFLGRLQAAEEAVAGWLRRRRGVEVLELDAEALDPQEIAARVTARCAELTAPAPAGQRNGGRS